MIASRHCRRTFLTTAAAALVTRRAAADAFRQIGWDDLIPSGVPYGEIVGMGEINALQDSWKPQYDENARKLNTALDGEAVRLPGYIIPFDMGSEGVTSFMLVPYVGACIHTPPPPPNQLVFVTTKTPWSGESLWDPVWVSGRLSAKPLSTELGEVGYQLAADEIEVYEW